MAGKNLLGSQIKRLLTSLSHHGNQHLTEVETDLVQTTYLLSEAIEKLTVSFMAIHEGVFAQQKMMDVLLSDTVTPESLSQINALQIMVAHHINSAVTSLQFQDMTSQLIGRTVRRIAGLREVLNTVSSNSTVMLSETKSEEMVNLLVEINRKLEEQSTKLESALRKAVNQTHMESGDIELF